MVKIKSACEQTGLSEKAIRLYIREGLVTPSVEEGISYKSYSFTEDNVNELKDISVLRMAGFSIDDIKTMKTNPEKIHYMVEERQNLLAQEMLAQQNISTALSRLAVSEQSDTRSLANAVSPYIKHPEKRSSNGMNRRICSLTALFLIILVFYCYVYNKTGLAGVNIVTIAVMIILAITCLVYSIYLGCVVTKAKSYDNHCVGTIVDILEDHGFDISFSRAGANYAGTSENGIGGIWQIFFLIWNELRFDCYYPLVRFYINDKFCIAQLGVSGFRNTWQIEQEIEIAWQGDDTDGILPLPGKWLKKKQIGSLLAGVVLFAISICFILLLC